MTEVDPQGWTGAAIPGLSIRACGYSRDNNFQGVNKWGRLWPSAPAPSRTGSSILKE
jgi:hypothetical protein